jgi:hypothetical protein
MAGSPGPGVIDTQRPSPSEAKQLCGQPGDFVATDTIESLPAHMSGQWLYCSGPTLYNVPHDGIEFTADGRWYLLQLDDVGGLARGRGFDGEGTWSFNDGPTLRDGGVLQISLLLAGHEGRYITAILKFESSPVAMQVNWMLGPTDYVGTSSPR